MGATWQNTKNSSIYIYIIQIITCLSQGWPDTASPFLTAIFSTLCPCKSATWTKASRSSCTIHLNLSVGVILGSSSWFDFNVARLKLELFPPKNEQLASPGKKQALEEGTTFQLFVFWGRSYLSFVNLRSSTIYPKKTHNISIQPHHESVEIVCWTFIFGKTPHVTMASWCWKKSTSSKTTPWFLVVSWSVWNTSFSPTLMTIEGQPPMY